jgi:hypothetical protein
MPSMRDKDYEAAELMTTEKAFGNSPVTRMCQLSAPEQLLVWTVRHRAFGGAYWKCASAELCSHLPEARAEYLLQALDRFIVSACFRARKKLTFHRLDCHCLGGDELSLAHDRRRRAMRRDGAGSRHRSLARWLVQSAAVSALVDDTQAVANISEAQGW